jgi:hypothetical protein
MKNNILLAFFCLFLFSIVTCLNIPKLSAQERFQSPDIEQVKKKIVFTEATGQYRLAVTNLTLYGSSYGSNAWNSNTLIYMIPAGARYLKDITVHDGSSANLKTVYLLQDDLSVFYLTIDISTFSIQGAVSFLASPTGVSSSNPNKILVSDASVYVSNVNYLLVNHLDGSPWIIDSSGLNKNQILDIAFDANKNVVAGTSKGLYKLKTDESGWMVYSPDSLINTKNLGSIFFHRDGKIYITNGNIIYYSSNNGISWDIDTTGLGASPQVNRISDDILGTTYAYYNGSTVKIYIKKAGETSWTKLDSIFNDLLEISNATINDIGGDNTFELATSHGIFTSTDFGVTFSNSTTGIFSENIYGFQFLDGGKLISSNSFGVYTKASPTAKWIKRYPLKGYMSGKAIYKDGAGNLYLQEPVTTTHQGNILKSTDGAVSWSYDTLGIWAVPFVNSSGRDIFFVDKQSTQYYGLRGTFKMSAVPYTKHTGLPWAIDTAGTNILSVAGNSSNTFLGIGTDNTNYLYFSTLCQSASSAASFIFKRPLSGSNWSMDTSGLNNASIISYQVDPTGKMIGGSTTGGKLSALYREISGSWQKISLPPPSVVDAKLLNASSDGNLYVSFGTVSFQGSENTAITANKGIYLTGDYGVSWRYAGLDSVLVRGMIANGNDMYAFTNRGVFKLGNYEYKQPVMSLSTKSIDFDTVSQYQHKDITVRITNTGQNNLYVSNINSTNGVFKAKPIQFTVAPSAFQDVVMTFTPTATGVVTGKLIISSNTYTDTITVQGKGINFGIPQISINTHLIDFGPVNQYKTKDNTITITNNGTDSLRITNISSPSSAFIIPVRADTIAPNASADFTIRFSPTVSGTVSGIVRITNNAKSDSVIVMGTGTNFGTPILVLNTNVLDFSSVSHYQYKDSTFRVLNVGTDTLRITSISSTNTAFTLPVKTDTIPPKSYADFPIRFSPSITGTNTGVIRFTSNSKTDTILVLGNGIDFGTPKLQLNTHKINFDTVLVGTYKDTTLTISNPGNDTLRINGIALSSPFTLINVPTPINIAIPQDSSKNITVRFTPTISSFNQNLIISSNVPRDTVLLSGVGKSSKISLNMYKIDFGTVSYPAHKDTVLRVYNTGTEVINITNITLVTQYQAFSVINQQYDINPGAYAEINVDFTPVGNVFYTNSLTLVNNISNIIIPLTGTGNNYQAPKMILSTHSINFNTIVDGSEKDTIIRISNTGDDILFVNNIVSSNTASFSASPKSFNVEAGAYTDVQIKFTCSGTGKKSGMIRILADPKPDTIQVTGVCAFNGPQMSLSMKSNDFGAVEVGKHKEAKLIVSNNGLQNLVISGYNSPAPFIASKNSANILPGGADTVLIRFTPTDTVQYNRKLSITSNAPVDSVIFTGLGYILPTEVGQDNPLAPITFDILPNPFTKETNIHIVLPEDGLMIIKLYDAVGKEVATLTDNFYTLGEYYLHFDTGTKPFNNLENGLYYCRLITNSYSRTKAIVILK